MAHPEERLAELGLSVPEVAKPVAVYVPAVRSGSHVFTSGQLPMRAGELMATGKVGGEVTQEEAAECAQQCGLNAIAAVKAEIGDLAEVKRVVKVVCFVASTPDFTGQPQVANGSPSCSAPSSAMPGSTRAPPWACPCSRSTPRSRSSSSSRSSVVRRLPLPDALVRRHARTPTGRPHRPSLGTRRPSCCCGRVPPARRSTCCGGRRRWPSPAGCACSPAAASTRATSTTPWPGQGRRRTSGRPGSGSRSRWPGPWCAPRCGRRSRSRACCWPARAGGRRRHDRRGLGGRPRRAGGARPVADRLPRPAGAGPAQRPARGMVGRLTPVFEPRRSGPGSSRRACPTAR